MYNIESKNNIVTEFTTKADINVELARPFGNIEECMRGNDASMAKYLAKRYIDAVASSVPKELGVDDTTVYINQSGSDDKVALMGVTISSKYTSDREFKFKKQFVYSEDVTDILIDFVKCTYVELITDALIRANLAEVNAKLEEIGKSAGNTFKVTIVPPMGSEGKKVLRITDEEVVFVADETRIFDMDDILVFHEVDEEVTEDILKEGYEREVASFAGACTAPQFIGVHDPLVEHICGISKLTKPFTLIKKAYSKNAKKVKSKKETSAYFFEDGIYAAVHMTADGNSVILHPFKVDTLEIVDYDVLANI